MTKEGKVLEGLSFKTIKKRENITALCRFVVHFAAFQPQLLFVRVFFPVLFIPAAEVLSSLTWKLLVPSQIFLT